MAFLDPLWTILIPIAHPGVDAGTVNVEQVGNLRRGVTVGAEQESLEAQGDPRGLVSVSLLTPNQELATRACVGLGKDRFHGNICRVTIARRMGPMRLENKKNRWARAPSDGKKKRLTAPKTACRKAIPILM
jgi:hypothetical protein